MRTLTNDYHDTEYRTRKSETDLRAIADRIGAGVGTDADKAFVRRVHNALCGSDTCTCGRDIFGRRED